MGGDKLEDTDQTTDTETQSDIDIEAATAEIGGELFGQGNEDADKSDQTAGEDDSSSDGVDADAGSSPQPSGEEGAVTTEGGDPNAAAAESEDGNSAEVQETGAPKTWTKEALESWATIPPRAQQEILKREEDFLKGIQGYKAAADLGVAYSNVVAPYAPILAAENIDPVQLVQSFAGNHYLLSKGTEQQKLQLAANLLDQYQIPLAPLLEYIANSGNAKPVDPQLVAINKELEDLKKVNSAREESERTRVQQTIRAEIDAFAADPKHPHFEELSKDIEALFKSGQAANLQEAYDKALYLNPTTRQKELDRITSEKLAAVKTEEEKRKVKVAKSTGDQLNVGQRSRNGTVPKGSMDDTLQETLDAIQSRA